MFRAVSLLGLAFLTVAAVALTNNSQKQPEPAQNLEPRPAAANAARGTAIQVIAVTPKRAPLYYAAFSVN